MTAMAAPTPIVLTRAAAADRVQGEFTLVLSANCSLWRCCTFLQDYNTAPAGGVHVLLAGNLLEGVALFAAWSHDCRATLVLQTSVHLFSYRWASTVICSWRYDGRSGRGFLCRLNKLL